MMSGGAQRLPSGYRPDIDGLRGVACLSVVAYHACPEYVPGGFTGVDVFFVISGFLISSILYRDLLSPRSAAITVLLDFYARRLRRLAPALLTVCSCVLAAGWCILLPHELHNLGLHLWAGACYLSNWVLFGEYRGYFSAEAPARPLLHLWSLGIEEQFYICFPLLLCLGWRLRLSPPLWIGPGTLLSLVLSQQTLAAGDAPAAFYLPWYRFWELGAGALLAWSCPLYSSCPDDPPVLRQRLAGDVTALIGLTLLAAALWGLDRHSSFPGVSALLPACGAILIIAAGPSSTLLHTLLGNKLLARLGQISYPWYLWHWPLLSCAFLIEGEVPELSIRMLLIAIALLLSILTWLYIEPPLRYGPHPRRSAAYLLSALLVMGGCGLGLHCSPQLTLLAPSAALGAGQAESSGWLSPALTQRQAACYRSYPAWAAAVDIRNSCFMETGKPARLWVIGDSHAGHLLWGLEHALAPHAIGYHLFGSNSQLPLLDFMTAYNTSSYIARKTIAVQAPLISAALRDFARNPQAQLVLLAHNPYGASVGIRDLQGTVPALDLHGRGRSELNLQEAQQLRALFASGARRTFELLTAHSKHVLVLLDIPTFPRHNFQRCLASFRPGAAPALRSACSLERSYHDSNIFVSIYNQVMQEMARQYAGVQCLDLAALLCDARQCHMARNGQLLYEDPGHLNAQGSLFVVEAMLHTMLPNLTAVQTDP